MYDMASMQCVRCGTIMAYRKPTPHILHLLMTIVTGGLWAIVWIGCTVKFGGWRCSACGRRC
jgi:hypothetical protein